MLSRSSLLIGAALIAPALLSAQSEAVNISVSGSKTITHVDHFRLHDELSALFLVTDLTAADVTALTNVVNGLTWADVLAQGAAADRNIDLSGHDLEGAGTVTVDLVLADSLMVTKVIHGQIGSLANHSTDALSEGSTNEYFTLTRSRNAITLSDAGGDGSLTYDNTTGEITYTGPSAAEVRAHFSPGTGVTIADGEVSIGQAVGTADDVTFGSVTADFVGDLTGNVTGTVSSLSNHTTGDLAEGINLYFTDARAQAAITGGTGVNVSGGVVAIGQPVGATDDVTFGTVTANLAGDVYGNVTGDLTGNVTGNVTGDLTGDVTGNVAGNLTGDVTGDVIGNLTGDVTGTVSSLGNHTTDALPEGANNLYFTEERSQAAMQQIILDLTNNLNAVAARLDSLINPPPVLVETLTGSFCYNDNESGTLYINQGCTNTTHTPHISVTAWPYYQPYHGDSMELIVVDDEANETSLGSFNYGQTIEHVGNPGDLYKISVFSNGGTSCATNSAINPTVWEIECWGQPD